MEEQKDFWFKYSDYSPEQIQISSYKQISDYILKLTQNEEIKEKIKRNFI